MTTERKYDFSSLMDKIQAEPNRYDEDAAEKVITSWCEENGVAREDFEKLRVPFGQFVSDSIHKISDHIPESPALKNKFFKAWTNDAVKFTPKQICTVLANYRDLTSLTRRGVGLTYAITRGSEAEAKVVKNLSDETDAKGNGENAHIRLLDQCIISTIACLGNPIKSRDEFKGLISPSTKLAKKAEEHLYTGRFITKDGITNSLLIGDHPLHVVAGVHAVSAAHEGKAPGMLTMLLEGLVKHLEVTPETINSQSILYIRKYFDEHLGEEMVTEILNGKKFSKDLLSENIKVSALSSEQLNAAGLIEQSHRKAANDVVVRTVMSERTPNGERATTMNDTVRAFAAAQEGFKCFAEEHGKFWDDLHSQAIGKVVFGRFSEDALKQSPIRSRY